MNIEQLSTEELEKVLKERKSKEVEEAKEKRKAYETNKNNIVVDLVHRAINLNSILSAFKKDSLEKLDGFYKSMHEYGTIAKTNKGNFSIKSADGKFKIEYKRQLNFSYDERAALADQKLKDFLSSFVKKRDNAAYDLITSLLEKDKAGNYDPRLITKLYKFEDKFDAQDWKDAIRLFKEAYQESNTAVYVHFSQRDEYGKEQSINLSFASL